MYVVDVPVLKTERLVLQAPTAGDFPDSLALWSDPAVTRFLGASPASQEAVWGRLMRYVGQWAVLGYGYWVVRDRLTGGFIGEAGFADNHRAMRPDVSGIPEVGWALCMQAQGRGLGREVVGALTSWADSHLGPGRTVCLIHPDNAASLRVARAHGYRTFAETLYDGGPVLVLERWPGAGDSPRT